MAAGPALVPKLELERPELNYQFLKEEELVPVTFLLAGPGTTAKLLMSLTVDG
jgi:hypothetical protein